MESVVLTSNTAVTPDAALIDMTVPGFLGKAGEGDWIELIAADIGHDSATSRVVTLFYQTPQNTEVIIGRWDSFANSGAVLAGAVSGFEPVFLSSGGPQANIRAPLRPIVVPQGWRLRVRGDTAAVAYTITVHGSLIVHSQSDVPAIYSQRRPARCRFEFHTANDSAPKWTGSAGPAHSSPNARARPSRKLLASGVTTASMARP